MRTASKKISHRPTIFRPTVSSRRMASPGLVLCTRNSASPLCLGASASPPPATVGPGPGLQAGRIGAGARLGQAERQLDSAAGPARQKLLLELLAGEVRQDHAAPCKQGQPRAQVDAGAGDFLVDDGTVLHRTGAAAIGLR